MVAFSERIPIALLSHPVVDALLPALGAPVHRGGYVTHARAHLDRLPVPGLGNDACAELETLTKEVHQVVLRLRSSSDSALRSSLLARQGWLRTEIEGIVSEALGLGPADLERFTG